MTLAGSGTIDASGVEEDSFVGTITGSGNVELAGISSDLEVIIDGSGNFRGSDLAANTGTIIVSGSGDALVNVSDELTVLIDGSGSVRYTGDPTLDQEVSGSGSVSKG